MLDIEEQDKVPAKSLKIGVLTVGDLVFANDFRIGHPLNGLNYCQTTWKVTCEIRKEECPPKVKPVVRQVTELKTNSKKNMKRNESPQKNPHRRVAKTSRKKGNKKKPHPELVPVVVIVLKPGSKVNAVEKTEDGDPHSKSKANSVLFRASEKNAPN
ncbi:unnamed protein product [Hymenolepis diminuta]|uniref:TFIIIC_sub6 domain-containing protein n=1 Tax=Hymenolepis diminuta TaxID=6216 RepID=A0A0R3SIA2_HYMDI|nr:unnamed protein product [Hymenolepis diminuta]VUZ43670.1 unnamed protein product [Hymenolepis diminuta]